MIEYKTLKKERYYSEVIRLYTELGYSIGLIFRIFPLSYGTVKRWLSIFAEERKENESAMKKKSSTTQSHIDTNEEIKALKHKLPVWKRILIMPGLKPSHIVISCWTSLWTAWRNEAGLLQIR